MKVAKKRSFVKSLTWRIIAIFTTFVCIYLVTGKTNLAGAGTLLTNSINFVLYYLHERIWNNIQFGRK